MPETPFEIFCCVAGLISAVVTVTVLFLLSIRGKLGYYADYTFYSEEIFDDQGKKVFEKTDIDGTVSEVHYVFDQYGNNAGERHSNGYDLMRTYGTKRGEPTFGKVIRSKDSNGITILYEYDDHGNMVRCFRPNYETGTPLICEENVYNEKNQKIEARVFDNDMTKKYFYNDRGFVEKEITSYKDNYDLYTTIYKTDDNGNDITVQEFIEDSDEKRHLVRDEQMAYNADGDLIYYKDFLHDIELYRVYLISKDKKSGFISKVCLQYKTKVY